MIANKKHFDKKRYNSQIQLITNRILNGRISLPLDMRIIDFLNNKDDDFIILEKGGGLEHSYHCINKNTLVDIEILDDNTLNIHTDPAKIIKKEKHMSKIEMVTGKSLNGRIFLKPNVDLIDFLNNTDDDFLIIEKGLPKHYSYHCLNKSHIVDIEIINQ
jgi:hypothetical protein